VKAQSAREKETDTMKKKVLFIGFDPRRVDFTTPDRVQLNVTEEKVLAGIQEDMERIRARGHEVDPCFIEPGTTAERVVLERLKNDRYDCVLVGAGIRTRPEALLLFERIINLIHEHAPGARIGFKSTPNDGAEAVERWI
jgi:hypothetical protein